MDFEKAVVIVTGSSSGIGEGCAKKLLDLGATVAGFDVRPPRITHARFKSYAVDVTDESRVSSAVELAPFGIRVNSVAPGFTATAITEKALQNPDARRACEKSIPLGRVAAVSE